MMNLLTEPVFDVAGSDGLRRLTLPGLLAALGADQVESIEMLQRHQADTFHMFLCSLAAATLVRAEATDPVQDEAFWREGVRRLSHRQDDCCWQLAHEDPSVPAFLQPPLTGEVKAKNAKEVCTPDALDLLPLGRNHDVKSGRITRPQAQHWVFALVSLQTASGFYGNGNFGIVRMNGGFGCRLCVSLRRSLRHGAWFVDDVRRLLAARDDLLRGAWGYADHGPVLLWEPPWDGSAMLPLEGLDPFFIEICRAVRLADKGGRTVAHTRPTKAPRLLATKTKALSGRTGDPWAPVYRGGEKGGGKALTLSGSGFTATILHQLLLGGEFDRLPMLQPLQGAAEDCLLYGAALVRGSGTTKGYQSIAVPIPARRVASLFAAPGEREKLAALSLAAMEDARSAGGILDWALRGYLGADDRGRKSIEPWIDAERRSFSGQWQERLFPWLWDVDMGSAEAPPGTRWRMILAGLLKESLNAAIARVPGRSFRQIRGRAEATGRMHGGIAKHFPDTLTQKGEDCYDE